MYQCNIFEDINYANDPCRFADDDDDKTKYYYAIQKAILVWCDGKLKSDQVSSSVIEISIFCHFAAFQSLSWGKWNFISRWLVGSSKFSCTMLWSHLIKLINYKQMRGRRWAFRGKWKLERVKAAKRSNWLKLLCVRLNIKQW